MDKEEIMQKIRKYAEETHGDTMRMITENVAEGMYNDVYQLIEMTTGLNDVTETAIEDVTEYFFKGMHESMETDTYTDSDFACEEDETAAETAIRLIKDSSLSRKEKMELFSACRSLAVTNAAQSRLARQLVKLLTDYTDMDLLAIVEKIQAYDYTDHGGKDAERDVKKRDRTENTKKSATEDAADIHGEHEDEETCCRLTVEVREDGEEHLRECIKTFNPQEMHSVLMQIIGKEDISVSSAGVIDSIFEISMFIIDTLSVMCRMLLEYAENVGEIDIPSVFRELIAVTTQDGARMKRVENVKKDNPDEDSDKGSNIIDF